jgi:hypothetical protein
MTEIQVPHHLVIEKKVHNAYGVCVHREYAAALSRTQQLNRRTNMLVKNLKTFVCVCCLHYPLCKLVYFPSMSIT